MRCFSLQNSLHPIPSHLISYYKLEEEDEEDDREEDFLIVSVSHARWLPFKEWKTAPREREDWTVCLCVFPTLNTHNF